MQWPPSRLSHPLGEANQRSQRFHRLQDTAGSFWQGAWVPPGYLYKMRQLAPTLTGPGLPVVFTSCAHRLKELLHNHLWTPWLASQASAKADSMQAGLKSLLRSPEFIYRWSHGSFLVLKAKKATYNMLSVCWTGTPPTVNFYSAEEGRWLATDQPGMVLHLLTFFPSILSSSSSRKCADRMGANEDAANRLPGRGHGHDHGKNLVIAL